MPQRLLLLLSGISFVVLLGVGIVVPLLPLYARDLGATATQVGLIFTGFSLSRTVFAPIIGSMAERREIKSFILAGLFFYGVIALFYLRAGNANVLIAIRVIHGIASACVLPLAMSCVALIAEEGREGVFMGRFNTSLFLGMGAGPLLGGFITQAFGMDAAFVCLAAFSFLSGTLTFLLLPPMSSPGQGRQAARKSSIRHFSPMAGLLFFRVITALGRGSLFSFIPLLAQRAGLNTLEVGILISANIFTTGLLQGPFGRLATRHNAMRFIMVGSLVSAAALACLPLGWDFPSFLLLGTIMGMGGALSIPPSQVMALDFGKTLGMTSCMSLFDSAWGVGMILGPVVMGMVMDASGMNNAFYAGGLVTAAGTGFFYVITKRRSS